MGIINDNDESVSCSFEVVGFLNEVLFAFEVCTGIIDVNGLAKDLQSIGIGVKGSGDCDDLGPFGRVLFDSFFDDGFVGSRITHQETESSLTGMDFQDIKDVVNYTYRALGEQLKRLDKSNNPTEDLGKYSYSGKELDEDINLYYFNARFYDATTGRFINVDPIQDGSNWYVYCENNPLNMVDPTGLGTIAVGANFTYTDIVGAALYGINKVLDKVAPNTVNRFYASEKNSYTISGGVYYDTESKDFGLYGAVGKGGGIPDLSVGGEVLRSPLGADDFLSGTSTEVGSGVGYGIYGTQVSTIVNDNNEIIGSENSISIGLGTPVDVHVDTEVTGHVSIRDAFKKIGENLRGHLFSREGNSPKEVQTTNDKAVEND